MAKYEIDSLQELAVMFASRAIEARSRANSGVCSVRQRDIWDREESTWLAAMDIIKNTVLVSAGEENVKHGKVTL